MQRSLIASGGCDEASLDSEFAKIYEEEQVINEKLAKLRANAKTSSETQRKINPAMEMLERQKFELEVFDNIIIRKLIECIKVLSDSTLLIIFKGGVEVKAEIEK